MIRNNFSQRVQVVIQLSREEALRLGHDYIGTEHLLLGLIREGGGVAIEILQNLDMDLDELKKSIEDAVRSTGGTITMGNIPFTKRAERVLRVAAAEAERFKSNVIGTEHLLLALLRDADGVAAGTRAGPVQGPCHRRLDVCDRTRLGGVPCPRGAGGPGRGPVGPHDRRDCPACHRFAGVRGVSRVAESVRRRGLAITCAQTGCNAAPDHP